MLFPDAAHEKRLLDTNVISGWNIYARLQSQLETETPLNPTDMINAVKEVQDFIVPNSRSK